MKNAVDSERLLVETDRQRNAESIAVFKGNSTFNTDDVGRCADMIIFGCHNLFQGCESGCVLAAERNLCLVVSDKLIACAGTADSAKRNLFADLVKFFLPEFGVCHKLAVGHVDKTFCDGEYDYVFRKDGKYLFRKPVNAEAADTADYDIRADESFSDLFKLIIFYACGKILFKLRVATRFSASVYNVSVEMSSDEADFVSVLSCGEGESRTHHSRADDCDNCHR